MLVITVLTENPTRKEVSFNLPETVLTMPLSVLLPETETSQLMPPVSSFSTRLELCSSRPISWREQIVRPELPIPRVSSSILSPEQPDITTPIREPNVVTGEIFSFTLVSLVRGRVPHAWQAKLARIDDVR